METSARSTLRIGTASWTERTLIDAGWYPPECTSAECRLRFYAERFSLVEVDSAYYAMPTHRNAELWAARTPPNFVFDVKAFRLFTGHQTPLRSIPADVREDIVADHRLTDTQTLGTTSATPRTASGTEDGRRRNQREAVVFYRDLSDDVNAELWKRLAASLAPLRDAGKMGVVLFQFPPWVRPHERVIRHIHTCRSMMSGFDLAVEFRNWEWFTGKQYDATVSFLRDLNISLVVVDEPQGFRSSVPAVIEVTGPWAIVRFHGRNAKMWEKKGLSSSAHRFNWRYNREELLPWVPRVRRLQELAGRGTHLIVNTNYGTQGPENAALLQDVLANGLSK